MAVPLAIQVGSRAEGFEPTKDVCMASQEPKDQNGEKSDYHNQRDHNSISKSHELSSKQGAV
jgi:hypothetical protein